MQYTSAGFPTTRSYSAPLRKSAGYPLHGKLAWPAIGSVLLHGFIVFGFSGASSASEPKEPLDATMVSIEWLDPPPPAPPPPEPETPKVAAVAAKPVKPPPREVRPEPPPPAPAPAEPQPVEAKPEKILVSESTSSETQDTVPDNSAEVAPQVDRTAPRSGAKTGRGAVGNGKGAGKVVAKAKRRPNDAERRRAKRRYVHFIERLIRKHARYPRMAARAGLQGRVVLALRIAQDGGVLGLRIASTSGHGLLDDAALDGARKIRRLPPPPALAALGKSQEVHVGVVYRVQ